MRSVASASEWLLAQILGGFCARVYDLLFALTDDTFLKSAGLLSFLQMAEVDLSDDRINEDEATANMCGKICMSLVMFRMRRNMWLTSAYLVALLGMLSPDQAERQRRVNRFKQDCEAFQDLAKRDRPTPAMKLILGRSCFQLLAVEQLRLAFVESGWKLSDDIVAVLKRRTQCSISSQLVEDLHNVQKTRQGQTREHEVQEAPKQHVGRHRL